MDSVLEICPICGQEFEMGYTGTVDRCDTCLGIVRDEGVVYHPGEAFIVLDDVETGEYEVRQRPLQGK